MIKNYIHQDIGSEYKIRTYILVSVLPGFTFKQTHLLYNLYNRIKYNHIYSVLIIYIYINII